MGSLRMFYSNPYWLHSIWIPTSPSVAGAASEACTNRGLPYQRWLRTASEQTRFCQIPLVSPSLRTLKEQERGIPLSLSLEEEARETCSSWILIEILNLLDSTTKLKRLDVYSELSLVIALKRKRRSVEKVLTWETEAGWDQPPRQIYKEPPHTTTPSTKPNSPTKCICPSPSYSPFYQKFNNSQSLPSVK